MWREKGNKRGVFTVLFLALLGSLLVSKAVFAASPEKMLDDHWPESAVSKMKKTVKSIDWDGDGKADKTELITNFEITTGDGYSYATPESVTIRINGKTAYDKEVPEKSCMGVGYGYFQMTKNRKFLRVSGEEDNDGAVFDLILRYNPSTGKFVQAADIDGIAWGAELKKVSKSEITFKCYDQSTTTGMIGYNLTYKYSKGKLVLKSRYAVVKSNYDDYAKDRYSKLYQKEKYVAKKAITFYTKPGSKKKAFSVKKGDIVSMKKIYIGKNKKQYIQFRKGNKKGWIPVKYGKEIFYGTYSKMAA